jgi:hypothetical protein
MRRRCARTFWVLACDPMLVQKRDRAGNLARPHTVRWTCHRCGQIVGESTLPVNWRMLAQLRRDAGQIEKARKRA